MSGQPFRINVPEPCSEKWEEMRPTERGAFCSVCSKNLYDFTQMTTSEIAGVIRSSKEKVCGRFRNDQLEQPKILPAVEIAAMRNAPQVRQFLYVLWMVFGLSLFSCTPDAQELPVAAENITKEQAHVDTLAITEKKVKGSCSPVFLVPEIHTTVGVYEEPITYETTAGVPVDVVEAPVIDSVYDFADQMPEFGDGGSSFYKFLQERIRYPQLAKEMNIQGTVFVEFTVHSTGEITNAKILRGIGYGCDEEALAAINDMPKLKPGRMNGRNVPVRMRLPVKFRLL